jgi:hypothetical protein
MKYDCAAEPQKEEEAVKQAAENRNGFLRQHLYLQVK